MKDKALTDEEKIQYLLIALKSQHQSHMDWVYELSMTVSELIEKVEESS